MVKRTGPTNPELKELIQELRTLGGKNNVPLYKRLAADLEKPTRIKRVVNLARINRNVANEDETIVVPGKVLATGKLDKKVNIVAWQFSDSALDKITNAGAKAISIQDFIQQKRKKGEKIKIIG